MPGIRRRQPMAAVYGPTPPWHDIQLAVRGPAVADLETVFRERWDDPAPLTRNPFDRLADLIRRDDDQRRPAAAAAARPGAPGTMAVQVLRTYPRRRPGYPFAPDGERSVAHAYDKVIARAHSLIYLEDQYLWATDVVRCFADALRRNPVLHLIAVIPLHPDQDGRLSLPPNLIGRQQALDELRAAGGARVGVFGIENHAGTPIYVHAKVCVVDDVWASVGSDNVNLRSWTHDSELSCAVIDDRLRPAGTAESWTGSTTGHGSSPGICGSNCPGNTSTANGTTTRTCSTRSAPSRPSPTSPDAPTVARRRASRRPPAGTAAALPAPRQSLITRIWATPLYRAVYDPDARPRSLRRSHRF